jgi:hypothetical protein
MLALTTTLGHGQKLGKIVAGFLHESNYPPSRQIRQGNQIGHYCCHITNQAYEIAALSIVFSTGKDQKHVDSAVVAGTRRASYRLGGWPGVWLRWPYAEPRKS